MSNLQTNVWGPPQWLMIHLLPLTYPSTPTQKDRILFATRLITTFQTLYCSICVQNVPKNLHQMGVGTASTLPTIEEFAQTPYFESTDTLFYFTFAFHNVVNKTLGKSVIPDSKFQETYQMYKLAFAKSSACKQHGGCTEPQDGYKPCMSKIAIVPRSLGNDSHGPAFYFDVSLQKST